MFAFRQKGWGLCFLVTSRRDQADISVLSTQCWVLCKRRPSLLLLIGHTPLLLTQAPTPRWLSPLSVTLVWSPGNSRMRKSQGSLIAVKLSMPYVENAPRGQRSTMGHRAFRTHLPGRLLKSGGQSLWILQGCLTPTGNSHLGYSFISIVPQTHPKRLKEIPPLPTTNNKGT